MDYCLETMRAVVRTMKKMLENYTEEYEQTIDGTLTCNYNQKRDRFYCAHQEGNRRVRSYISPLQAEGQRTLKQLARKEYLAKTIPRIQKNLEILERGLKNYRSLNSSEVIEGMKRAYRMLDSTWFFNKDSQRVREMLASELMIGVGSLEQNRKLQQGEGIQVAGEFRPVPKSKILLHRSWAEEPYERNPHPFGEDEIYTSDGTRARSKAEALIYEGLQKYKVPFKFDALLSRVGPDGIPFEFAPDFIFEDSNLEEFYWEFCGMMDREEYVQRHLQKRKNYEAAGIVPWKNIIYSYSSGNDIDMAYVESVIRNQIIPRL